MLEQAQRSLDAAAVGVHADAEGALDDILAARLLLSTALAVLDAEGNEV
jgi:hypothetical protein